MGSKEEIILLASVAKAVSEKPQFASKVMNVITNSIQESINKADRRSADMEVLAMLAFHLADDKDNITQETKDRFSKIALHKIEKLFPNSHLEYFDHIIKNETNI